MTTVAIMQPYFMPYAGYFRLFAAADVFVVYDCVQFPRRGWVHRNRFALAHGEDDWLTLPVARCARDTRIEQLNFAEDADARLAVALQRFPGLHAAVIAQSPLLNLVTDLAGSVADYLCRQLATLTSMLDISRPVIRSSSLALPDAVHAQQRIIEIVRRLGADRYVNAPGGRALYDAREFAEHGIELRFLAPYTGPTDSILSLLLSAPSASVAASIVQQTTFD